MCRGANHKSDYQPCSCLTGLTAVHQIVRSGPLHIHRIYEMLRKSGLASARVRPTKMDSTYENPQAQSLDLSL